MTLIKNLLAHKTLLWIAVIYSFVITGAFFISGQDLPKTQFYELDKVFHIIIYFILVNLWMLYIYVRNRFEIKKKWILALLLSLLLYGIIIEIFQELFTQSRTADIIDVAANLVGSLLGIFFFKNVKHKLKA
jgi:VanZ family protein